MTALLRRALLSCVVAGAVDVATLRGSTIAMVGDSTMRTQFERLCGLLNASAARTPAKPLVVACAGRNVTVAWMSPKDRGDFGFHKGLEALGHVEEALGRPPTAIYANGGLHYLHLLPARDFECFQCWASAEFFLRRFVVESRRRYAGATLVFMTGHVICRAGHKNDQNDFNRKYSHGFDTFFSPSKENFPRESDPSKSQPKRLRCDRAREV